MVREPVPDPSRSGSVVLDLGPGVGALVLHAAPEMDGREIEVSTLGGGTPAHRTHSRVRPRETGGETQYAAVYPQLAAGDYTIWKDDVTPAATVTIEGGQVTTTCWPGTAANHRPPPGDPPRQELPPRPGRLTGRPQVAPKAGQVADAEPSLRTPSGPGSAATGAARVFRRAFPAVWRLLQVASLPLALVSGSWPMSCYRSADHSMIKRRP